MRGYDQFAQGFFISLIFLFSMQYVVPEDSILHLYLIAAWIGFLGGVIFPDSDCYKYGLYDSLFNYEKYKHERDKGSALFRWPKWRGVYIEGRFSDPEKDKLWRDVNASRTFTLWLTRIAALFVIPSMYFFRYLIYKPEMFILKRVMRKYPVEDKHRHISHCIFGTSIAAIMYGVYWLVLDGISILVNLKRGLPLEKILAIMPHYDLAIMAGTGFFIGTLIHMVQDSMYAYKIRVFYPFSSYVLKGTATFDKGPKPESFWGAIKSNYNQSTSLLITIIFLLISGLVMVYYPYILEQILKLTKNYWGVFSLTMLFDFMLVFLVYGIFFKLFKVKIEKEYPQNF